MFSKRLKDAGKKYTWLLSVEFYGMSYQFAWGMIVQKYFALDSVKIRRIRYQQMKKQAKLPFVISFHFEIIRIFNNPI